MMSTQDMQVFKLFERNILVSIIITLFVAFGSVGAFLAVIYDKQTSYATKFTDNLVVSVDKLSDQIKEMNKINAELRIELANQRVNSHVATTPAK